MLYSNKSIKSQSKFDIINLLILMRKCDINSEITKWYMKLEGK